ncbi:hypothetical protein DFJ73DRAFT_846316 [Zopfochytrium polystomum]|nr:hypothetical protein DFJ73DRAFT_846316 [Zopfochytrium polystomum]
MLERMIERGRGARASSGLWWFLAGLNREGVSLALARWWGGRAAELDAADQLSADNTPNDETARWLVDAHIIADLAGRIERRDILVMMAALKNLSYAVLGAEQTLDERNLKFIANGATLLLSNRLQELHRLHGDWKMLDPELDASLVEIGECAVRIWALSSVESDYGLEGLILHLPDDMQFDLWRSRRESLRMLNPDANGGSLITVTHLLRPRPAARAIETILREIKIDDAALAVRNPIIHTAQLKELAELFKSHGTEWISDLQALTLSRACCCRVDVEESVALLENIVGRLSVLDCTQLAELVITQESAHAHIASLTRLFQHMTNPSDTISTQSLANRIDKVGEFLRRAVLAPSNSPKGASRLMRAKAALGCINTTIFTMEDAPALLDLARGLGSAPEAASLLVAVVRRWMRGPGRLREAMKISSQSRDAVQSLPAEARGSSSRAFKREANERHVKRVAAEAATVLQLLLLSEDTGYALSEALEMHKTLAESPIFVSSAQDGAAKAAGAVVTLLAREDAEVLGASELAEAWRVAVEGGVLSRLEAQDAQLGQVAMLMSVHRSETWPIGEKKNQYGRW